MFSLPHQSLYKLDAIWCLGKFPLDTMKFFDMICTHPTSTRAFYKITTSFFLHTRKKGNDFVYVLKSLFLRRVD